VSRAETEDPRLARLAAICAELPEANRTDSGRHATFRVRGRTFAYYLDDHQGDGIVGLACKVPGGQHETLVETDPDRFYRPAYIAHRGWIGVRLDRGPIDWDDVAGFVVGSYRLAAPKRLAARVAGLEADEGP